MQGHQAGQAIEGGFIRQFVLFPAELQLEILAHLKIGDIVELIRNSRDLSFSEDSVEFSFVQILKKFAYDDLINLLKTHGFSEKLFEGNSPEELKRELIIRDLSHCIRNFRHIIYSNDFSQLEFIERVFAHLYLLEPEEARSLLIGELNKREYLSLQMATVLVKHAPRSLNMKESRRVGHRVSPYKYNAHVQIILPGTIHLDGSTYPTAYNRSAYPTAYSRSDFGHAPDPSQTPIYIDSWTPLIPLLLKNDDSLTKLILIHFDQKTIDDTLDGLIQLQSLYDRENHVLEDNLREINRTIDMVTGVLAKRKNGFTTQSDFLFKIEDWKLTLLTTLPDLLAFAESHSPQLSRFNRFRHKLVGALSLALQLQPPIAIEDFWRGLVYIRQLNKDYCGYTNAIRPLLRKAIELDDARNNEITHLLANQLGVEVDDGNNRLRMLLLDISILTDNLGAKKKATIKLIKDYVETTQDINELSQLLETLKTHPQCRFLQKERHSSFRKEKYGNTKSWYQAVGAIKSRTWELMRKEDNLPAPDKKLIQNIFDEQRGRHVSKKTAYTEKFEAYNVSRLG